MHIRKTLLIIVQHTVPKPCTAEYISEIETWEETKEVRSKEEVMQAEFGYTNDRDFTSAVSLLLPGSLTGLCWEGLSGGEERGGENPGYDLMLCSVELYVLVSVLGDS